MFEGPCKKSLVLLTAAIVGSLLAVPAMALDFNQCVTLALKQNPQMLAAKAQQAEAKGAVSEARGHLLPKLNASFSASQSNNALTVFGMKLSQRQATFNDFGASQFNPSNPNSLNVAPAGLNLPGNYHNYGTKLQLEIPIWNGGEIWGRLSQAHAMLEAAQSGNVMARQKLTFAVLQAYDSVIAADSAIQVAKKAEKAAESYVKTSKLLLDKGVLVKSDWLAAEVNLEKTRLALENARNDHANALENLSIMIGWPEGKTLAVEQPVQPLLPSHSLTDLQREALTDNAGIIALQHKLKAAQDGIQVARAAYLPHVNAMANQEWNGSSLGNAAPSYTVGGEVTWNVLDFARGGGMDRAQAEREQAMATLQEAQDKLRLQVAEAWRSAREAALRVKMRQLAVQQMEESQRLVRLRYENGVETITGLLHGQAELDQSRAELVSAYYAEAVQRGALLLAMGKLNPQEIVDVAPVSVVEGVQQ
ncbi:TolC family protein [Acidithiobacillus montserratensis]|uniref:TolC family protein n=1 Tax=Acidithiobacillus montserratensis TaxID=2729135 RepID=A0ACD5HHP5_9PROT|nr:TolC family protein [Acidithiobacillus montserratensis]MBN2679830.1 TolC family protein [Acidithiobacillaceae bacterium]MBU2748140.1 TolC family protein [Acidithiobacillus montserratensis]